jgi:hypothetical protein
VREGEEQPGLGGDPAALGGPSGDLSVIVSAAPTPAHFENTMVVTVAGYRSCPSRADTTR